MAKNGFGKAGRADKAMQGRWRANNARRLEKMHQKAQSLKESKETSKR